MKYPFLVYPMNVEEHTFWAAESLTLRGCAGQGDTMPEAMSELEENEAEWLETAQEVGIPIPPVPEETAQKYSGKLTVRVAPSVHKKAAEMAKREGVSLNQYINDAIVSRNAEMRTVNYVPVHVRRQITS